MADFDGDGRIDAALLTEDNRIRILRLIGPNGRGAYDSSRLISASNGYGATTSVEWLSAKNDSVARHQVPQPGIVVGRMRTSTANGSLASVQYAYGDEGFRFDAASDHFVPTGFGRRATLVAVPESGHERPMTGAATVVDSFAPSENSGTYDDYVLTGLPLVVHSFDGAFEDNAWPLLRFESNYAASNLHGETTKQYNAHSRSLSQDDCVGFHDFYETVPAVLVDVDGRYDRPCATTGYAYPQYTSNWRGDSHAGDEYVATAERVDQVDDLGRALRIEHLGDLADPDDDVCEQVEYAGGGPFQIRDAVRSRTLGECRDSGGKVYARVDIAFDEPQAGPGSVTAGLPTTITSHVYETASGIEQTQLTTKIEYDSWGNQTRRTQTGDGDTRVATFETGAPFSLSHAGPLRVAPTCRRLSRHRNRLIHSAWHCCARPVLQARPLPPTTMALAARSRRGSFRRAE